MPKKLADQLFEVRRRKCPFNLICLLHLNLLRREGKDRISTPSSPCPLSFLDAHGIRAGDLAARETCHWVSFSAQAWGGGLWLVHVAALWHCFCFFLETLRVYNFFMQPLKPACEIWKLLIRELYAMALVTRSSYHLLKITFCAPTFPPFRDLNF